MDSHAAKARRKAPLATPAGFASEAVQDIAGALKVLLADCFALYIKTKNFHWHMSGRISATIICCWMNRLTRSLP